ncbi:DNA-binding GntR family transcriptional regulator [Natronocella acetinitrilica]|uniref:DNA-binding GntR family transcriptional regulator n=1 Tax=Natronocella acetinitrilica TaxID=414046 RepID=A0AAE3KGW3_9GAMM|nr:FCD domain-containing protein [Natronocella acetinitrilica]MCP1675682.1 DNA-binding GntR family transcriptional regulator [Natronocella acetinitrilica]
MVERLRRDLINGRFAAGQKLAITTLRETYSVGLSPLREALNHLAATGLLIQETQRGFRVPALSLSELEDLALLRKQLESTALERAIARGDADWESELLAAAHRLTRTTEGDADQDTWERRHSEFHQALVSACDSPWLERLIAQLHDHFDRYRRAATPDRDMRRILDGHHDELVRLTLQRDSKGACQLLEEHIHLAHQATASGATQSQSAAPSEHGHASIDRRRSAP